MLPGVAAVSDEGTAPCDGCTDPVSDALARTVRLTVDRSRVDDQRLCPACFADWMERYDREMRGADGGGDDDGGEIIVD